MKFTSLFAMVGAACAQTKKDAFLNNSTMPFTSSTPCYQVQGRYYDLDNLVWNMQNGCNANGGQAAKPAKYNNWQGCDPAKLQAAYHEKDQLRDLHQDCNVKRFQRHTREQGVDIEDPSNHDGDIHFSVNWQNVTEYAHQWGDWFEGEAHSNESQEIAMHLNAAAKKMVNSIAGGQADIVRNGGHLVNAFTQWAEPGAACDSEAYVQCLANDHSNDMRYRCSWNETTHNQNCSRVYDPNAEIRPMDALENNLKGHCAQQTSCAVMNGTRAQGETGAKYAHATQNALAQMAHEVQNDVMGEMQSQRDNAMNVAHSFLTEARDEWTKWGCEPKCTDRATSSFRRLHRIKHCDCPATFTVSGDTSIILHEMRH